MQKPPPNRTPRRRPNHNSRRPVRREVSAGGVAVRREGDQYYVALLKTEHKRGEVWVLPKGHVEPQTGETVSDAAKREVMEEAGLTDLSVKEQLGVTHYSFQADHALVRKTVHYFLMTTQQKKLTPQAEESLIDATWQTFDKAIAMLEYDTDQLVVARARDRLLGRPSRRPTRGSFNKGGSRSAGGSGRIHT